MQTTARKTTTELAEPELRRLMSSCIAGNDADTALLLTKLSLLLRSYFRGRLMRIGRSAADAEDLVQETLILIHTHRHTYDPAQPLTPWAYAIARYRLVDYLRRTKTVASHVGLDEIADLPTGGEADAVDSRIDLHALISQLTSKMRQAIELVKLEGLSVSEAAIRAHMSESAIKVSVHRGLRALAKLVRQRSLE